MMDYVAIFFGIWVLICWQLIAHTIRENPELHLVYKRPKWMQERIDKSGYWDKIGRMQYLKKRIEAKPYDPNDRIMQRYIRDYVQICNELKASDSQRAIHHKHSQVGNYEQQKSG